VIAATLPVQRPADARILVVDARGRIRHASRSRFVDLVREGDLVIANDAATLPASLAGTHERTDAPIEVRLAGRGSLSPFDVKGFSAIVFGGGDYHTPTERRPLPPPLERGDRLRLGPLEAIVTAILGHPRLVSISFVGTADSIWAGIAHHGRPIQYAHIDAPLALWDVWTAIASRPVAFEPPSAGFALDWFSLGEMRRRGVEFATITHAAGISSTGDEALDAWLPFDEPYDIPVAAALAIDQARAEHRRIIAVGTTVVRALEHAAAGGRAIRPGPGIASGRITPSTTLHVVSAILSGVHERSTSHYQLLGAFTPEATLREADAVLEAENYRSHEYGDSVFIEFFRKNSVQRSDLSTVIVDQPAAFM
jgi:S-adenosylmethionine:tRNA ribosyltransferase-isomerase